jgi:tRNA modification GTPase
MTEYQLNDTICAIATPPGDGAIAIIRLSGKEAILIANKIFSKDVLSFKSHSAQVGNIIDPKNNILDSCLMIVMISPNSYTGEDIVEINCHGGHFLTKKIFELILSTGARAANPGEFTYRAFLNNKIDLTRAEAVQSIIGAKNELALSAAEKHLSGHLYKKIKSFQDELVSIAAIIEAWVDYPEEGLEFASFDEIKKIFQKIIQKMQNLENTFEEGQLITSSISLAIVGSPNVGKSSLMNLICKKEKAIVTKIAGTTRDILDEEISLDGLNYKIIDTAGIRKTSSIIEKQGIEKSLNMIKNADIVLLVLDASKKLTPNDLDLIKKAPKHKTILIHNKCDLIKNKSDKPITPPSSAQNIVKMSAKEEIGLDDLKIKLKELVLSKFSSNKDRSLSKEEVVITHLRHKTALSLAIKSCMEANQNFENNISAEFIASDIKECLNHLSQIIGIDVTEDILSSIFSKFCVGK